MGQVPIVPPGTPPMDGWVHYSGIPSSTPFIGRHSPNIPMSNPHLLPMETMPMIGAGVGRMMPPDVNDNSQAFPDYPPASSNNHVEVY